MSYDNYSNLYTEQQMIAEAKKFVNESVNNKLDKAGGTMTGSIVTTSHTAIKPQTHDTGTVGELNNRYVGGYFNTIHVKGSNANGSYGIELSGAEDAGTIEFAKEADSDESYRQVFQNKDGTLALTSDIEVSEEDIASSQTLKSSVVTVTDAAPINAEDITVDITPQQDLHGYDRPWAGGAWKNKLVYPYTDTAKTQNNVTFTDEGNGVVDISINGTSSARTIFYIHKREDNFRPPIGTYKFTKGFTNANIGVVIECYNGTAYAKKLADSYSTDEVTFSVDYNGYDSVAMYIEVMNGVSADLIKAKLMIRLATEADATFAPYSNICPIEGWTGAELDRDGANLWDDSDTEYGYLDPQGVVKAHQGFESLNYREISPGNPYTLSFNRSESVSDVGMRIAWYDANKQFIRRDGILESQDAGFKTTTATAPSNAKYARASICITNATDIKFYQGQQYTASFGETVYGGVLDVTTGELRVTHGYAEFDGSSDENWYINEYYTNTVYISKPTGFNSAKHNTVITNQYSIGTTLVDNDFVIVFGDSINVKDSVHITSVADWKTYLTSNPLQLVYELAAPQTIQLTPTQVKMLQGINTVSADCGDTSLKYQPDNVIGELKGEIEDNNAGTVTSIKVGDDTYTPTTGVITLPKYITVSDNAGYHNSIYRGKSLGTSITTAQWNAISAGTFNDMYIGDYWTLSTTIGGTTSNVKYVIAGFDYWWNCGDSYPQSSNKHHIVLVPESSLYNAKMNDSNITTGGYVGSKMYTDYLANARTGISTLFGNHLYSVRRLFTNTVNTAGQAIDWSWYTSSVDLMNETMVYGYPVWTTSGFEVGVDRTILPLFALNPTSASISAGWWLRGVATSSYFAGVSYGGFATCNNASNSFGVRPAFAIY